MDRRKFMNRAAAVAAASFTTDMTLSQRAEAFEGVMIEGLPYHVGKPVICEPDRERSMACLLYTSPSPRDRTRSRMPSSA